ncbi:MAG: hypothetical protein HZB91_13790 [Elusimicrobia bacterium]|nr:hypothetical protein [Elusimicrobiota bacterium]
MEMKVWSIPADVRHPEGVRYSLAFIPRGHRHPFVLYDNHHPKGHHRHVGGRERPYDFHGVPGLVEDFRKDVFEWKARGRLI